MARRVYADFDGEVKARLANRTDITSAMRGQFLNDAILWCALSYKHPEIEATTTGTQAQDAEVITPVASDIWHPRIVKNTDAHFTLDPGDMEEMEDIQKLPGDPRSYYWWGRVFTTERLPEADVAYKIWYIKKPAEFTSGSPALDSVFDPVIIMKAAEIGLTTVRDFKEAAFLKNQIDQYVERFDLPKLANRKNNRGAGLRPRRI